MHSLVFKRSEPESPGKKMAECKVKESEHKLLRLTDSSPDSPPGHCELSEPQHHQNNNNNLFNYAVTGTDERSKNYCQPCQMTPLSSQMNSQLVPHSSTCSYGIQALLNNVHRGYATDGERTPGRDQQVVSGIADLGVDVAPHADSEILRQWKSKKDEELKERKRDSQTKLDHILEQAAIERENFYKVREAQIEAKKQQNREREAKYHAEVETKEQVTGGNLWEAVAALIDLSGDGDSGKTASGATSKHSLSPKSMGDQLSTPRKQDTAKTRQRDYLPKPTKKTTDLSRMREILLKLQRQPLVR